MLKILVLAACEAAISLLISWTQFKLDSKRVKDFATKHMTSIPRSLRIKLELSSRPAIVRSQEFRAIEEKAKADNEVWQQAYIKHYRKLKMLEKDDSASNHTKNFFKTINIVRWCRVIIHCRSFYLDWVHQNQEKRLKEISSFYLLHQFKCNVTDCNRTNELRIIHNSLYHKNNMHPYSWKYVAYIFVSCACHVNFKVNILLVIFVQIWKWHDRFL